MGALDAFVRAARARLHHVKPHGALYMMGLEDREISRAICVHSDTPGAPKIARAIRQALKSAGIAVRKP